MAETEQTTPETYPAEAVELMAQIVSRNAADAAYLHNQINDGLRADLTRMAQAYIDLFQAVDKAAGVVTTRALEKALSRGVDALDRAYRIVEKEDE